MASEFQTTLPPISFATINTVNITDQAFMEEVIINNLVVENTTVNNLEVEQTLVYNTLTNGQVTITGNTITGLAPPTEPDDAATLATVSARTWKNSVKAATTAPIVLTGTQIVDNVSLNDGDRILVKNQASPSENGFYIVKTGSWKRSDDGLTEYPASGSATIVQEGTANADKLFFCTTNNANFGDSIAFAEISGGGGGVIAGNALGFVGSRLDVQVDGTTIQFTNPTPGANALELVNDDLTIATGSGITGGGLVALGGTSTAIAVDGTVIRTTGGQTIGGTGLTITGTNGLTTDTLTATSDSATVSLYDGLDTGALTLAANSNSTLQLGGTGTTVTIPGGLALDNIEGATPGTSVSIYDTTTTGTVEIANNVTTGGVYIGGTADNIYLGDSTSNIHISGTIVSNDVECSTPTSTVNMFGGTTSGTVNVAANATGTINIGSTTATTVFSGTTQMDTIEATTVGSTVSVYDNVTTGNITLGTSLTTGDLTIGSASTGSSTTINGVLTNNEIQGTSPTTAVSLFDTTTSGTVDIATSSTGTVNLGTTTTTIAVTGDLTVPNTPTSNTSAVTRGFVNSKTHKDSVRYTSTGNITLASITGATTVDGFVPGIGDRVLLKDQTTTSENGIYVWTQAAMTDTDRALDALVGMQASGTSMITQEGTTNGDKLFFSDSNGLDFGDLGVTYTEISGSGTPGGSPSNVQYNSGGSFAGDSSFTFDSTTNILTIGDDAGGTSGIVTGGDATAGETAGGAITLEGGDAFTAGGTGGVGGDVNITGGNGAGSGVSDGGSVIISGGTPSGTGTTGTVELNSSGGNVVIGDATSTVSIDGDLTVGAPTTNNSVVNRGFVNSKTHKDSVVFASTGNITLGSITGATTVDGVVPGIGDRVLLKNQTTTTENGIYVWTQTALTDADRALDALVGMKASGTSMIVQKGSTNLDKLFFCDADDKDFGDTLVTFTQISGGGGGTPDAPNASIQFNNSSSFGGSANLVWSDSASTMTLTGKQKIATPAVGEFSGTPSSAGSILEIQGQTFTDTAGAGTRPLGTFTSFSQPTFTADAAGVTITDAATLYIENSPNTNASGGSTVSLPNPYALLVAAGKVAIRDTTDSMSTTTGALVVTGGLGCGANVRVSGNVYATGFIATSDAMVKSNIEPLTSSLTQLKKVETYKYNLEGCQQKQYGVLAQQLEEAGLAHMVANESDHKYVNYLQLIPMLIDSVKELSKEVADLKRKNKPKRVIKTNENTTIKKRV